MPEISRFYGIVIKMYFDDHHPPHFHAEYGDSGVVVNVETLAIIAGHLPPRAMGMVTEWASLRQKELQTAWAQAQNLERLSKIEPLP